MKMRLTISRMTRIKMRMWGWRRMKMSIVIVGFWPGKALCSKNVEKPFELQEDWDLLQGCCIQRDHYYICICI